MLTTMVKELRGIEMTEDKKKYFLGTMLPMLSSLEDAIAICFDEMPDDPLQFIWESLKPTTANKKSVHRSEQVAPQGHEGSLEALCRALAEDKEEFVRRSAADTIGGVARQGHEGSLEALYRALAEDNERLVRRYAVAIIAKVAPQGHEGSLEALYRALAEDKEENVRGSAATAIGGVAPQGHEGSLEALCRALAEDNANLVRSSAVRAIAKVAPQGHEGSLEALYRALGEGRPWTVTLDKSSGERLGIDVDLGNDAYILIDNISQGLVMEWNQKNLAMAVQEKDCILSVNGVRGNASSMVQELKSATVLEVVIQRGYGQAADDDVRKAAADAVGVIAKKGDEQSLEKLRHTLAKDCGNYLGCDVRVAAAAAIGLIAQLGDDQSLEALRQSLAKDFALHVRMASAKAIEMVAREDDEQSLKALHQALAEDM